MMALARTYIMVKSLCAVHRFDGAQNGKAAAVATMDRAASRSATFQ